MEGPVKERLTGALILVAALVIIVPEMLTGPGPRPSAAVGAAPLVDAGPPMRSYSMELNGAEPRAAEQVPAPQPAPAEPPSATPAATPPVELADDAPTVATTAPPSQAATGQVAAEPAPAASVAGGRWWAQLGSFSARDNADRLTRQLRAAGFAIDMSKVSAAGKELYRVRAGPVRSRDEAQELQARLTAAGHKSAIVPP